MEKNRILDGEERANAHGRWMLVSGVSRCWWWYETALFPFAVGKLSRAKTSIGACRNAFHEITRVCVHSAKHTRIVLSVEEPPMTHDTRRIAFTLFHRAVVHLQFIFHSHCCYYIVGLSYDPVNRLNPVKIQKIRTRLCPLQATNRRYKKSR